MIPSIPIPPVTKPSYGALAVSQMGSVSASTLKAGTITWKGGETARRLRFRFDDVSINTDYAKLHGMVAFLRKNVPGADIMFAVSPLVHSSECATERVFPAMLHVEPDFRTFYKPDRLGLPPADVLSLADTIASHGLLHVDHRLLKKSAQEMSLVVSCAILGTHFLVLPFHKHDHRTRKICREHDLTLVRSEGAVHLKYHDFGTADYYYLHTHDFATLEDFCKRFPTVL